MAPFNLRIKILLVMFGVLQKNTYQFEAEDQASCYTSHPDDAPLASLFMLTQKQQYYNNG